MRQAVLANTAALIGSLVTLSPWLSPLSAQAPAATSCNIEQSKPKELGVLYFTITQLGRQPVGPGRDPLIKSMLKDLYDKPEKFTSNPGGYNYLLSQVLTLLAQQDNGVSPTTRGALGMLTRPTEVFDPIVELDAAYDKWEAAAPGCASEIATTRSNEAWLAVTNKAFGFVDKGPADSAVFFAQRSIMLSPNNPFAHHILASVAQGKKDMDAAAKEWKEVVKLSAADSTYRDIKQNALFYLGLVDLQAAVAATGDAQKTLGKSAAGYFQEFLKNNPSGPDAPNVMTNLLESLKVSGDTAQLRTMYTDMIANSSKYGETILANAGVAASLASDMPTAAKLFAAVVESNPLSRDGLRNYASTLLTTEKFNDMFPPLRKLVELEPNNFDGIMLFAYAAQGLEKTAKTPAEKKAWTDTLVKYNTAAEKLAARVEVNAFNRSSESVDVTLAIENVGATPGNYSVSMDFLDKAGAVVSSATETLGPVAKGEKKTVTLKGAGKGIVAFKYKPLG